MASFQVQAASFYIGGVKAAEIHGSEYDVEGGDTQMFGDGGALGFSKGALVTKLSVSGFHPKAGMKASLMTALINKTDIDVTLTLIDGKIHQIPAMRVLSGKVKSEHKDGTQMCDYTLGGGPPSIL